MSPTCARGACRADGTLSTCQPCASALRRNGSRSRSRPTVWRDGCDAPGARRAVDVDTPLDAERILRILAEYGVEYVLVGGLAVQTHGHVRTTIDLDIFPRPAPANLARLADALNALGARVLNPGSEGLAIDA